MRFVKAESILTASPHLVPQPASSMADRLLLPLVGYEWTNTVTFKSRRVGPTSRGKRFEKIADNLAEQHVKPLRETFDEWIAKDGLLPELPALFYPGYAPAPTLSGFDDLGAQQLTSTHGLLNANETYWSWPADAPADVMLPRLAEALTGDGWKQTRLITDLKRTPMLRLTRGAEALEVCRDLHTMGNSGPDAKPRTWYARYAANMPREKIVAAITDAADNGAPLETLLVLEPYWTDALYERLALITPGPQCAQDRLALALLHHERGRTDHAERELRHAAVLFTTAGDGARQLRSNIESVAKRLGHKKFDPHDITVDDLRAAGMTELDLHAGETAVTIAGDEPALVFICDPAGELHVVSHTIVNSTEARFSHWRPHSRTWGTSQHDNAVRIRDIATLYITTRPAADRAGAYTVTFRPELRAK